MRNSLPILHTIACLTLSCVQAFPATYNFTEERSSIEVHVPKAGLLSFAGHEHYLKAESFSGSLNWDPASPEETQVVFNIPVTSIAVLDSELKAKDRETVKEHMQAEDVLNAERYGVISFRSTNIKVTSPETWKVDGVLTVAGQPAEISFAVDIDAVSSDQVDVSGNLTLKLADFSIKPVSALAGAVKTGKSVGIDFEVTAIKTN